MSENILSPELQALAQTLINQARLEAERAAIGVGVVAVPVRISTRDRGEGESRGFEVPLARRLSGYGVGLLGLPGGKLEKGETILAGAHREAAEETGIRLEKAAKCVVRGPVVEHITEKRHWISHYIGYFISRDYALQRREPDKMGPWQWVHEDDLVPADVFEGERVVAAIRRTISAIHTNCPSCRGTRMRHSDAYCPECY
jgi:8-oxo-dGTP pyrophosphatase MutT (NUDIX family)